MTVASIYEEAAQAGDSGRRKSIAAHATRSESAAKIRAMLDLAKSEEPIAARPGDFNRNPWMLQCSNGRLDLRTGELSASRPEDYNTRLCPIEFRAGAPAERFERFVSEILGGDANLVNFLGRFLGYALTAETGEQCFAIFWGSGSNGKTTLLELIADPLGDYAARTPAETLMASRTDRIPNDLARLHGRRFVIATESGQKRRLDEAAIKRMTGGDKIAARFLHKEYFEFRPEFKIALATNHRPTIGPTWMCWAVSFRSAV